MAKVPFTKLNTTKSIPAREISFSNQKIIVEQYLPLSQKLDLIQTVIELSGSGEEGFFNIVKLKSFYTIEMIKAYTNISFTEKQQEDPPKLYDAIVMNGIWEGVIESIPQEERDEVWGNILTLAREVTEYNHSALGILKLLKQDYGDENFALDKINEMLTRLDDSNDLEIIKTAVDKMG